MIEKIVISGGTGFVGSNLLSLLGKVESKFYILTTANNLISSFENVEYVQCNILDLDKTAKIVKAIKPTKLLHMAWSLEASNYNLPVNFDWIKASINLLECFHKSGGNRVCFIGTGVEYNWEYGLCKEDYNPKNPNNLYGTSKNILSQYVETYCKFHKIEFLWLRLFFLYGPYENKDRLIPYIINCLLNDEVATIKNGEVYRDYMYVKDAVNMILDLLFSDINGDYNIGTGKPLKLGYIAELIGNIMGKTNLLNILSPQSSINNLVVADVSKLSNVYNTNLNYSITDSLEETINWWKKNI